jgi:hypothetical protein
MKRTVQFPLTSIALVNGVILVSAALFLNVHLVQLSFAWLQRITPNVIDDIVVAIALGIAASVVDHIFAVRRASCAMSDEVDNR